MKPIFHFDSVIALSLLVGSMAATMPPASAAFFGFMGAATGSASMLLAIVMSHKPLTSSDVKVFIIQALLTCFIGTVAAFLFSQFIVNLAISMFPIVADFKQSLETMIGAAIGLFAWRLIPVTGDVLERNIKKKGGLDD